MKKISRLLCVALISAMLLSLFEFTCFAEGASNIKCNTSATVGEQVSVTVTVKAGAEDGELWGASGNFSFDTGVLAYSDCNGAVAKASGGDVKFTLTGSGNASASATFNFNAIASGKCVVSANNLQYSGGRDNSLYNVSGSSVAITVKDAESADNGSNNTNAGSADLSALRVTGTQLSPAFSAACTSYSAQVKYSVSKVTVSATSADSGARISGTGVIDLSVGENKRTINVTSSTGTKKAYTLNIKRLSEEETAALDAEQQGGDPLSVTIDGSNYRIVQDISAFPVPDGYTAATETIGSAQVGVLKDNANKYVLYYLTDSNGGNAALYARDENNDFYRVNYLLIGNRLFIIEQEKSGVSAPEGFYADTYALTSGSVRIYRSEDPGLIDFCWFYAYVDGNTGYYRYDTAEKTMQRAPDFTPLSSGTVGEKTNGFSIMNISTNGKIIIALTVLAAICIIVIIILLIIKFCHRDDDLLVGFDADDNFEDTDILSKDFDNSDEIDLSDISDSKDK